MEEEIDPWQWQSGSVAVEEGAPDLVSEEDLEPGQVEFESMEAERCYQKFCWRKSYPFYVRQSDPKRFVVECPSSTMKKKVKKNKKDDGENEEEEEEGGNVAGQQTNEEEVASQMNEEEVAGQTDEEEVAGKTNEEEVASKMNANDNFAAVVMNKCTFVFSARLQKRRNDQAVIIKRDLNHSCGCMFRPGLKQSVGTSFITAQSRGLLEDVPNAAPAHIQVHVRRCQHAHHANYMTAHRAKKRVEEAQMSDEVRSFQLIQPYFSKLMIKMPGTVALLTRDEECRLLRTFVSCNLW
jgi:hypothetical protein